MNSPSAETISSGPTVATSQTVRLGGWNVYFLGKFALYWWGLIGFHALGNLAFALLLLLPLRSVALRRGRSILAWPVAIGLLYYDSWLPPLARLFAQANLLANFSLTYLLELAGRFINPEIAALLVAIVAAYVILARWIRFGAIVMTGLLSMTFGAIPPGPARPPTGSIIADDAAGALTPDQRLNDFFSREADRSVSFPAPAATDMPYDLIFLHVCSLSWDDLQVLGLESHPLLSRFDITFNRFNSVTAYSGPAAIRLQRAACGQQPHHKLYERAPENCYLMEGLRTAGFKPAVVLNHDGHFDDFLKFVQAQLFIREPNGMATPPLSLEGVKVTQYSFDGSPVYDDAEVLDRWLSKRKESGTERAAVYFNSVSLHDGNHLSGDKSGRGSMETYKERLKKLLDDLDGFIRKLESSGQPAVVALIPEHGAAVRGDRMQIAGLREIPSPAITLVPVGIKVVGPGVQREGPAARIETPSSFLAISEVVARMLARSPFSRGRFSPADYTGNLPTTRHVAENDGAVVMQTDNGFLLRLGTGAWEDYRLGP